MDILAQLNDRQKQAVTATEGPVLVLAGAGSGKTKALVSRAAFLLQEKGVAPFNILAITFTNKAAAEMQSRMESMTGISAGSMWIGTFHGICLRILRRESAACIFNSNFVIYDDHDQQVLLKKIISEMGLNDKEYAPRAISSEISKAKNLLLTPEDYENEVTTEWKNNAGKIYGVYQKRMLVANALDFDDLIMTTVKLFEKNPEILKKYQQRFKYLLVDEYQDTNYSQYYLIQQLAGGYHNICAVGDPDQSIYGWRGADISNILNFEKDYKNCQVIKLEQNYRSTKNILAAANAVISHNTQRKPKELWTEAEAGEMIEYHELPDDRSEGVFVVETLALLKEMGNYNFKDFAVIYRTHTQARVIEDALMKYAYPYRIYGGLRFYERKEVKDTIAYLRLLVNPRDDISLTRIINEPKRSIGASTLKKLDAGAKEKGLGIYEVLNDEEVLSALTPSSRKSVINFYTIMEGLRKKSNNIPIPKLLEELWQLTGYAEALKLIDPVTAEAKTENLQEFVAAAVEFEKNAEAMAEVARAAVAAGEMDDDADGLDVQGATLENFLAQIALSTDLDKWDEEAGCVTLLTMHATKGLEFPVVFMVGLEEKIFPHSRSFLDNNQMEEERRLCYVAMTRARERLFITRAKRRNIFGHYESLPASRFISEIPEEFLDSHCIDYPPRVVKEYVPQPTNLFTGKNTNTIITKSISSVQLINIGDKVQHAKFGIGIVVKTSGGGEDSELHIAFPGQGIKVLVQKYAPIKLVVNK